MLRCPREIPFLRYSKESGQVIQIVAGHSEGHLIGSCAHGLQAHPLFLHMLYARLPAFTSLIDKSVNGRLSSTEADRWMASAVSGSTNSRPRLGRAADMSIEAGSKRRVIGRGILTASHECNVEGAGRFAALLTVTI
jgi:hypothetical protein